MKVLHVTPAYYPASYWGGPIFSVYGLNNALAQLEDIELVVLTTDSAGPTVTERLHKADFNSSLYPNQKLHICRRLAGHSISLELLAKLPRLVRWADVVHVTATYSFPVIPTLLVARLAGTPVVWSPRGAIQDAYEWPDAPRQREKRIWELVCRTIISEKSTMIHTTSDREKTACRERLGFKNLFVSPNGVQLPEKDRTRRERSRNLRLIFLGRLSKKKGLENLMAALCKLEDLAVELRIFGSGPASYERQLRSYMSSLNLDSDRIRFMGPITGNAKSDALTSADICVVPSYTENFCIVVAEALAHGVPVIASKGTPWEKVQEYGCGLWVENDPESLSSAVRKMANSDLVKMGSIGRQWMESEFTWAEIGQAMRDVYQSQIEKCSESGATAR